MSEARPTLGDVARAAGVHKATASRALNEATIARVSPETAGRVARAAAALGYRPNVYARGLRTRSSRTVGVIVPDIVNPVYPPLVRGIEDALTSRGYTALLANTDLDPERERTAFDNLLARLVDGFVVGPTVPNRALCAELAAGGTPVVVLTEADDVEGVGAVEFDYGSGVEAVVDHLVALGHRRIAHVAGPPHYSDCLRRAAAYREALAARGLDPSACPVRVAEDLSARSGAEAVADLLAEHPDVTAIAAYNDVLAVGALRAVFAAGMSCPEDVSVVGFNDLPMVGDLAPALTTVRVASQEMGYAAATMLLSCINGTHGPLHVTLPVALVRRESTGPAKGD